MIKRRVGLLLSCLLLASPGYPRQDQVVCGTNREKRREELYLHRQSVRARQKLGRMAALSTAPAARDIGDIAILSDADGVVAQSNNFNLDQMTVSFLPASGNAATYHFQVGGSTYDAQAATDGTKIEGFGDDDTRLTMIPFPFPFYGTSYQKVYINSDGNLTFGSPDTATSERSLGRVTSGPPRIAPLFRDLDPSRYGQVKVLSEPGRLVVSWITVPEFQDFGVGPVQTFQARLYPGGRIDFAFNGIGTSDAVVGISPGKLLGPTSVVHFVDGSTSVFSATIAERFGGTTEIDIVTAAQKFFQSHDDAYDYLVIFNTVNVGAGSGAIAYEVTVRNDRSGYGDLPAEAGQEFGSASRLQAVMNMGQLSQYPADPSAIVPHRGEITGDTPLSVLAHEAGHLFLAYASVRDASNPDARPMLGAQLAHWSFVFDSEASLLEGNRIKDNGSGQSPRFLTTGTVEGYSPLDQYLMGFRAPEGVAPPDLFLVTGSGMSPSRLPQKGVSFNGSRRDIAINEIIQAEGRRTPDYTVSQRHFRFAFLLVTPQGQDPSQTDLDKLENFRKLFEGFYNQAASGQAWADASLRRSLQLSAFPAAGVLAGRAITGSVSIEKPAEAAITVTLVAQNGAASVPAAVTIAGGQTSATFQIHGDRAGVEELSATPSDARYMTAYARIQVLGAASGLSLAVVSGGDQAATPGTPLPQPVVLRVVDVNRLPYPGLTVQATVSDGGTVTSSAVTDEKGMVGFWWTPGSGATHQLTAAIEGAPGSSVAVALPVAPAILAGGVVNAASYTTGLSPGGFASIFGSGLAAGAQSSATPPYPYTLSGVQVWLNGQLVPLQFVSDGQINFVAPSGTAPGVASLMVSTPAGNSLAVQVQVLAASPGIFFNTSTNYGAVVVYRTGQTTDQTPLQAGDILVIYCTGLGAVEPYPPQPALQQTVLTPSVLLAGSIPLQVQFSGLNPVYPGLYQINAQIPQVSLPSGDQDLVLQVNGKQSNAVKVRIQ